MSSARGVGRPEIVRVLLDVVERAAVVAALRAALSVRGAGACWAIREKDRVQLRRHAEEAYERVVAGGPADHPVPIELTQPQWAVTEDALRRRPSHESHRALVHIVAAMEATDRAAERPLEGGQARAG